MNIETANRLLQYRKENNLSQEELAEKIGVSRQAVSKWERAEASPDTDNLIRLAEIYGVSLDEMLTGKKTQAEPEPEPQPEPQTDESNTGSFEPDPDTNYTQYDKVSFKKGIHVESKDGDKVHISFKDGVNVYEKHGDKVHVGWDGVNVNEKGKTRVYTDENGHVMVDDEIKNAFRSGQSRWRHSSHGASADSASAGRLAGSASSLFRFTTRSSTRFSRKILRTSPSPFSLLPLTSSSAISESAAAGHSAGSCFSPFRFTTAFAP